MKVRKSHILMQVNSDKYPWIAQLVVRDLWYHEDPIFSSSCSAVLVGFSKLVMPSFKSCPFLFYSIHFFYRSVENGL